MSQQPSKAAVAEQQQQPVARPSLANEENGSGSSQTARHSAPSAMKQPSDLATMAKGIDGAPQASNGLEGGVRSWVHIAMGPKPVNGNPSDKQAYPPATDNPKVYPTSGVTLPVGVTSAPAPQGSIKFGSIDPAEMQQSPQSAPPPKPAPAQPVPPPQSQPTKPSFAAAVGAGTKQGPPNPAPQQGRVNRAPRAPQQQVSAVAPGMPQGAGYTSQPMTTFVLSPNGTPVAAYPQAYMLAYNPAAPPQQYYAAGGFAQGQYPGYNFGSPVQGVGAIGPGAHGGLSIQGMQNMQMPQQPGAGAGAPHARYGGGMAPPAPASMPNKTSTAPNPPPVRQKKILRIEDPNTHEVLDLAGIQADRKKAVDVPKEAAAVTPEAAKEEVPVVIPEAPKEEVPVVTPEAPKEAPVSKEVKTAAASEKTDEKPSEAAPIEVKKEEDVVEKERPSEGEVKKAPEEKFTAQDEQKPVVPKSIFEDVAEKLPSRPPSPPEEKPALQISPFSSTEVQKPGKGSKKVYSNEFMMSLRHLCTELPPNTEPATLSALLSTEDRPRAPPGPPERDWKSSTRVLSGGPVGGPPGMRGGRQNSRRITTGIDADTWERGRALPPLPGAQFGGRGPPPGIRMSSGPLPALHKTESAYRIGKTSTDDPEEEKAQKALKSMLNKITPQNFTKITAQIVVEIKEREKAKTLQGFIDQIFDKALIETTFSELYANLVASLNPELPSLMDEEGNPVQFRRTLLNKCQEEFETGVVAMKAVAERERKAQQGSEEDKPETEEGEVTDEQRTAAEAKQHEKEIAEAEVKARRRMLGNIIFVGQLYRFGVLTELVMHSCIKQLLEETQHPRPEDVECLCKLLSTVGRALDSSTRGLKQPADENGKVTEILTKDLMEVYFNRIADLTKNEALDARHRFMLHDLIDLRKNSWVERRKSEGPKKIEDIHRDAAMERSRSQMLDRQQSRGGRDAPRGPRPPFDNRLDAPIRTMARVGSQDGLGSQSLRPGGRPPPPSRPARQDSSATVDVPKPAKSVSPEETEKKVKGLLAEVYMSEDIGEAVRCVKDLADASANLAAVIELAISISLESKGTSWDMLRTLLLKISEEKIVESREFEDGIRLLLNKLDDMAVDVPKAPVQVGEVLAALVGAGAADLKVVGRHLLEADMEAPPEGEDTMMVSDGVALKVLGVMLQGLKSAKGADATASAWGITGLKYQDFIAADSRADAKEASKFIETYGLEGIL